HIFTAGGESSLATPAQRVKYGDRFCVMGAEGGSGGKYWFLVPALDDRTGVIVPPGGPKSGPQRPRGWSGPGMCAPRLVGAGWLDMLDPHHAAHVNPATVLPFVGPSVTIGALHGAP